MATVHGVMEELVKHLKVVRVGSSDFECVILHVFAHGCDPFGVLEVASHVIQDLLFFHGALSVLVRAFLNFESIQLFVLQLQGEPDSREVAPTKFTQNDVSIVNNLTKAIKCAKISRSEQREIGQALT